MADIISLFRKKKNDRGRIPLSSTHIDDVPLEARMLRIKESLEKINHLMKELKQGPKTQIRKADDNG